MTIADKSRFPAALQRHHGASEPTAPRREGPSPKEIALMSADEYKRYMQGRGEWQESDREAISAMRNADPSGLRRS